MLNKTGWRIKHLISRSNQTLDKADDGAHNDYNRYGSDESKALQRQSWSSNPSQDLETSVQRTFSNATKSQPLAAADFTTHSSASSLCSCEGDVHVDCEVDLLGNSHSLSSVGNGRPNPAILYLPVFKSSTSLGSDAKTWKLIFSESPPPVPAFSSQRYMFESQQAAANNIPGGETLNLLEALAIKPSDDDVSTPTATLGTQSMAGLRLGVVENVERSVQETDATSQAVGTALKSAKSATSGWVGTHQELDLNQGLIILGKTLRGQNHRSPPTPGSPLSRSSCVSKASWKKGAAKKAKVRKGPARVALATSANSRWTLTDMADVLSTKIFKPEVDEMLTLDRLQQLRIKAEIQGETSFDTNGSSGSDESSNIQPDILRIEAVASSVKDTRTISSDSAPITSSPQVTESPPKSRQRKLDLPKANHQHFEWQDTGMIFNDVKFPSPPQPCPAARRTLYLETIPEASPVVSFTPPPVFPTPIVENALWTHDPEYIFLPSTEWTMVSPLFRHGSIRIKRFSPKHKDSVPGDDSLDWIAFQMAISGGVSETFEDIEDLDAEGDETTVSEIMEWWADLGFESAGRMIDEEEDAWRRKRFENDWYEQTFIRDREGRDARDLYTRSIFRRQRTPRNERRRALRGPSPNRTSDFVNEPPVQLQRIDSKHTEHSFKLEQNSPEPAYETTSQQPGSPTTTNEQLSGPPPKIVRPNPPRNFAMPSSRRENEEVVMSSNLEHDLGDYLRWDQQSRQSIFIDHPQL